tara:strand:+ start:3511 stop:3924 length:414 start_codon:yes stop_codon:yes gene_type:complete
MFDKMVESDVVKASEVARTRQVTPLTITVTDKRITNTFSLKSLVSAGISIDDTVDLTYSKDGKFVMVEAISGGLKLSTQGTKAINASVRLTNKEGVYPDFIGIYSNGNNDSSKITLVNGEIEYDKVNRRFVCELKLK